MKPSPQALSCPTCAGPVTYGAVACSWCTSPLEWKGGIPPLETGEGLLDLDLRSQALPDPTPELKAKRTEHGTQALVNAGKAHSGNWSRGLTSCSVELVGAALDPSGMFGVLARVAEAGRMRSGYGLLVKPGLRTWRLLALLWEAAGRVRVKTLRPSTFASAVAGVGHWNAVELRAAGTLLEVRINHQIVETVVDGIFGYGAPGWWVEANKGPGTFVLNRLSVRALD